MSKPFILLMILLLATVGQLYVDIYTPSLPNIAHDLHTTATLVKLSVSSFLLTFGLGQLFYGILSDTYGRKPLLIIGLFICLIGSILAVVTQSIYILILARALQGLGVASASSLYRTIMSDSYHDTQTLSKVSAKMNIAWTSIPIIAPVIGAYIQHYLGWRYTFGLLSIYSLFILLLLSFRLPETIQHKAPLHYKSILNNIKTLVTSKLFVSGIVCTMTLYAIVITFAILGPFLIQVELKYNVISFGHFALYVGAALAAGSLANTQLLRYFSSQSIYIACARLLLLLSIGFFILACFVTLSIYSLLIPIIIISIVLPIIGPNVLSGLLTKFKHIGGISSAFIGFIMFFSASIITAIESHIHAVSLIPLAVIYLIGSIVIVITTQLARSA